MATKTTTAPGRIVWGNPLNGRPKTDDNNQPIIGNDGQQVVEWSFGLAIEKSRIDEICPPAAVGFMTAAQTEATQQFPNGAPPSFAWKMVDGDGIDNKGQPYANRTGYAGCYVLAISTQSFAPRCYQYENGAFKQITEGIKTGDYVQVGLSVKGHQGNPQKPGSKPGLYLNPEGISLVGYGEEIITGASPDQMFGAPAALPPGASSTPLAAPVGMPTSTAPAPVATAPVATPPMQTTAPAAQPAAVAPAPTTASPTNAAQPAATAPGQAAMPPFSQGPAQ